MIPSNLLTRFTPSVFLTSRTPPMILNSVLYTSRIYTNPQIFFRFSLLFDYTLYMKKNNTNAEKKIRSSSTKAVICCAVRFGCIHVFFANSKIGGARRSRSLPRRDPEASRSSAAPKPGWYAEDASGLVTGLTTSKCLRDIGSNDDTDAFLLLPITGLFTERDELAADSGTATYSTCPSSTMFEIRKPLGPKFVPADTKSALCVLNQRSLVSGEVTRRRTTFFWLDCKSNISCRLHPSPSTDQGLFYYFTMTLSEVATASFNMATPLSEKTLLWVKEASRTKSCTQAMTPSTAWRLMATEYKLK